MKNSLFFLTVLLNLQISEFNLIKSNLYIFSLLFFELKELNFLI